jgi:hypothetical protein
MNRSEAGKLGYKKTGDVLKKQGQERTQKCIDDYEANPKFCLHCGTKIPFEKRESKFCNRSCSASYNNRGVTRHIKRSKFCQCGNPKKLINKYCDECIEKRVYNKKYTDLQEAKNDRVRKRILLEQREHKCEVCGLLEWNDKPIPLELDHIDGNTDNNTALNLRLICPNCHAQTETYKGANAGKDSSRQQMRRKRYAEGKTY